MYKTKSLFNLSETLAAPYLSQYEWPWDALNGIADMVLKLGENLDKAQYHNPQDGVWVSKTAMVAPSAFIAGPCIIGHHTEIRHNAFIRGSVLVGENVVVGNSSELKNTILFNGVQVPHFNYVGDSILGYKSHMGAGSITSNVKSDNTNIDIYLGDKEIKTGLRKIGGMIGDGSEIGCNSVLAPGCILGKNARIYPLSFVRGAVPANHVYKAPDDIVQIKE